MGFYNQIFIIASHVTDLLFSFLLPHFFSSIHVCAGSVSANSVVAIPSASCKPLPLFPVPHWLPLPWLSHFTSPDHAPLPPQGRLGAQQCSSHRSMAVAAGTGVPGQGFPLTLPALLRDTGSFEDHLSKMIVARPHLMSWSAAKNTPKECHKPPGTQAQH